MLILKNAYRNVFFLFLLICNQSYVHSEDSSQAYGRLNSNTEMIKRSINNPFLLKECPSNNNKAEKSSKHKHLSYYLYISDFINSFIEIPTSNVSGDSTTISSTYLAGRAPVYNRKNEKVGTCSASFLCMQNADGIYTDISNYLSVDNGLIVTWFTPTTLINLELDSIVHSMVTECLVRATTKVGFNPFYGKEFNMVVSSDDQKIYFKLTKI